MSEVYSQHVGPYVVLYRPRRASFVTAKGEMPVSAEYEKVVPPPGEIEWFFHALGVNMGEAYRAKRDAECSSGRRAKRLVLPQPVKLQCFGLPVVFGPVDKPTVETE